ncbi:Pr6Pr family membrane protein [Phenylobacterium immobile]|uniref:Pr6Pr family membrane protein n=1 Tax=Phenylobacterium immobile TaxID=21 RepID=UPI000B86E9DA|nr:Pr6Pr family membrane protein [Phenylobacterium immobile]
MILQTVATLAVTGDGLITALAMARYFTILSNLAFAVMMTLVALGRRAPAGWVGGATLCMMTVGVVYALLLEGFLVLPGLGPIADIFLHKVSPIAAGLFWLVLAPKGELRWRHAFVWLGLLTAYGAYALLWGWEAGFAIYPFLDPGRGWGRVILTLLILGGGFLATGLALVSVDRRLARHA